MNRNHARLIATATIAIALALTGITSASAATKPATKNTYEVDGLPRYLTKAVTFEVIHVKGRSSICSITYGATTDDTFPFEAVASPSTITTDGLNVSINLCNGKTDSLGLVTGTAYYVSETHIASNGGSTPIVVTNATDTEATVVVYHKALAPTELVIPAQSNATVVIPSGDSSASAVVLINEKGVWQEFTIKSGQGWSRIGGNASPTFAPCATVTWSYDATGHTDANVENDIINGLALIAAETGLTFTRVGDPASAQIQFRWGNLSHRGPDVVALGGPQYGVAFSSTNSYMGDPTLTGTGLGGKTWMVAHEVMHVLGFGHTSHPGELMTEYVNNLLGFGEGDREGIRTLYPTAGCAA